LNLTSADALSESDKVRSLAIALLNLSSLWHRFLTRWQSECGEEITVPVGVRVDSDQQTDLSPVGRPLLRARLKSLSPSFCAELEDESAPITDLKKDLTKEIEDDDPDNARHRESIDSNAVFSWKSEDERHFQSEFKKRWLTSTDQIQALCAQNAILQAEVRRLELEKAALVKRLPLE
jgi:hypothetical protein